VEALQQGRPPVFEPGLAETDASARGRLTPRCASKMPFRFRNYIHRCCDSCRSWTGAFSLRYVLQVCEAIGRALAAKRDFHVVVLTSTVMPGATGGAVCQAAGAGQRQARGS